MKKNATLFTILILLLLGLFVLNVGLGSVKVEPLKILEILFSGDKTSTEGRIIFSIRLPRVMEALFLGGALALSGYLLQTFFANPIAGPYILGISSGAKLIVALVMVSSMKAGFMMKSWMLIAAAFVGSIIVTGFVLAVSTKVRTMSVLVVCGVMVGYICSAVTELVVTFADDINIVNLHNWALGTFSAAAWSDALYYVPITVLGILSAMLLSKTIEAYMSGVTYATTLGVNIRLFRTLLIILSSVLSATVTAFAGPVSFVGIAMPHVARTVFGTGRPKIIIPASFLMGAAFCLFSDLLARSLFSPTELSISTVTAVFGAPVVISMMMKRRAADV
jgi:iron complex transport system permease protein